MKKCYTILLFLLSVLGTLDAQQVVLDFESAASSRNFQYFGSSLEPKTTRVLPNPKKAGINTSANALEFIKTADAQTWAGAFSTPDLTTPIDLTKAGAQLCIKVLSRHVGNIALKLEAPSTGGANWIQTVKVEKANEWVEVCLDPSLPSLEDPKKPATGFLYSRLVIFMDFGVNGPSVADTTFLDDVLVKAGAAPTTVPVRFAVDMSKYTESFSKVYVSGTFNNWSGDANPLSDPDGDKIWTAELPLATGSIEYKFQVDGWKAQESFLGTEVCTKTTGGFTNRFLVIPSAGITRPDTVCWNSCYACGQSVRITVQLGAQQIAVAGSGLFIAGGGNFGNPGDFQLKDEDKDGIYTITFERPKGFTSFYTFTNGNCPDYSCKENIAGQSCANPDNYNDRKMGPFNQDTTIRTCFGQCTTTAQCGTIAKRKVTLNVDMAGYSKPFVNLYVSGTFNNWSANANKLSDDDGDNKYQAVLELSDGTYEFKYQIDGWSAQEEFKGGESCTKTTGAFTNRVFEVKKDTVLPVVCFNACTSCKPTSVTNLEEADLFRAYPNPVDQLAFIEMRDFSSDPMQWVLTDASGRQYRPALSEGTSGTFTLATAVLPNGVYWLRLIQGKRYALKKIVVLH